VASHRLDLQERANFLLVRVDRAQNIGTAKVIDENFHNSDVETETSTKSDSLAHQRVYRDRRGDDAALIGLGGAGDIVGTLGRASGWAK
jgi:hypothetical protein